VATVDGGAAGADALVVDLVVAYASKLAGAFLAGALDVFLRHRHGGGVVDGDAQLHIHDRVGTAVLGRHHDGAAEFAPHPAAGGVCGPLLVLDVLPVRMACPAFSL